MTHLPVRMKWTIRAHDQKVVFIKGRQERPEHVYMKIFIWALYLPQYPDSKVEMRIGDHYKPDVVSLDANGNPRFWGEAGRIARKKIFSLARRFPDTHFVIGKWDKKLDPFIEIVSDAISGIKRTAPFDLISFSEDCAADFIDEKGHVKITHDDVTWVRLEPAR